MDNNFISQLKKLKEELANIGHTYSHLDREEDIIVEELIPDSDYWHSVNKTILSLTMKLDICIRNMSKRSFEMTADEKEREIRKVFNYVLTLSEIKEEMIEPSRNYDQVYFLYKELINYITELEELEERLLQSLWL